MDSGFAKPDLVLTDTTGKPFGLQEKTAGTTTLVFFGYTNCPDVCPTTMGDISAALAKQPEAGVEIYVNAHYGYQVRAVAVCEYGTAPPSTSGPASHDDRSSAAPRRRPHGDGVRAPGRNGKLSRSQMNCQESIPEPVGFDFPVLGTDEGRLRPRYGNQVITRVTGQFLADGSTVAGTDSSSLPDQTKRHSHRLINAC